MKPTHTLPLALLALLALKIGAAEAHHSFPAVYDPAQLVTVEGEVTRLDLTNPHAFIYLAATDDNGATVDWVIEMPGKLSLVRRGWTDETLRPGDNVTAIGHPSLSGEPAMWWQRVQLADGTEYLFPALADQLAVEAERRERARRLSQ
jgi:hypothetical protein